MWQMASRLEKDWVKDLTTGIEIKKTTIKVGRLIYKSSKYTYHDLEEADTDKERFSHDF